MPELPDVVLYLRALERFVVGRAIQSVRVRSPFVVRTFEPELASCAGRTIDAVERSGKRIVWQLSENFFIVFHLMIAGRFHWKPAGAKPTRKVDLAAFGFEHGTLMLTEASQHKRASIHVVEGRDALAEFKRGGLEVIGCSLAEFTEVLRRENHTLKRALTDPTLLSGIGNAYSDEILHAARLSPVQLTSRLSDEEIARLHAACQTELQRWIDLLNEQCGKEFPEKVSAFRPEMAVHGRYGDRCPVCESPIQRIVYATRETNYCAKCQTDGKVLKDRSLSRLLKDDWPDMLE